MRIREFDFHAPADLKEALDILGRYGPEAKLLAGGTDLLLALKHRTLAPPALVSLHRLSGLKKAGRQNGTLLIGPLVTHQAIFEHQLVKENAPVLANACGLVGSWQIRNVATIGGNICNASPAADSAGPLMALDCRTVLQGRDGQRTLPIKEFFTGPGQTALDQSEMLVGLELPMPKLPTAGCFLKAMRKNAVDLAQASVTIQAWAKEDRAGLERVAIALGGVAPTPLRAVEAEDMLRGLEPEKAREMIPKVAEAAVAAASPMDDVRSSADYRRVIIDVYVKEGLQKVLGQLFESEAS